MLLIMKNKTQRCKKGYTKTTGMKRVFNVFLLEVQETAIASVAEIMKLLRKSTLVKFIFCRAVGGFFVIFVFEYFNPILIKQKL